MRKLKDRPHAIVFTGEGRTEQSHLADTDINVIMKRALRGQHSPYVREDAGAYGDASSLDFFEANVIIAEGNTMFEELPSNIRSRFKNNVGEFLDFIQDPTNKPEAIELGLIKKPPPETKPEPTLPKGHIPDPKPTPPIATPPVAAKPLTNDDTAPPESS